MSPNKLNIIGWLLILLMTCTSSDFCRGEEAVMMFDSEDSRSDFSPVLIPSFLVKNITMRIRNEENPEFVSPKYMSGFLSQTAQNLTGNVVHDYRMVRSRWYSAGAQDADKFHSSGKLKISSLKEFGFIKCKIKGVFSMDSQFSDLKKFFRAYVFASRKQNEKLNKLVISNPKKHIDVELVGWLSPPALYDIGGASGAWTRIFVVDPDE